MVHSIPYADQSLDRVCAPTPLRQTYSSGIGRSLVLEFGGAYYTIIALHFLGHLSHVYMVPMAMLHCKRDLDLVSGSGKSPVLRSPHGPKYKDWYRTVG
jgi:hypothetical protein